MSHLLFKYSSVLMVNIPDLFQSPCSSSLCQNGGACIPNYDFNSYDCLCAQGFVGEYCQKGNWYVSIPSSLFQRFVSTNFPSEVIYLTIQAMYQFFDKRGYPVSVVKAGHHRAQQIDRQSALQTAQKVDADRTLFTLTTTRWNSSF